MRKDVPMSVGRWARLFATIAMVGAVVTMVHGSEAPKFGFDALGLRKASPVVDPFLIDLQERTFRFFWDTANPKNGLVPDRYPTPSFSSVAAVGFALTAYPVGVERGYVTRKAARQRVLATLRFFNNAPQSPHARGVAGYERAWNTILDSNVTTLIAGLALLIFGSGPVRGFAVVHCLGIMTSMFSAVFVSRGLVALVYGGRKKLEKISIGQIWKPVT